MTTVPTREEVVQDLFAILLSRFPKCDGDGTETGLYWWPEPFKDVSPCVGLVECTVIFPDGSAEMDLCAEHKTTILRLLREKAVVATVYDSHPNDAVRRWWAEVGKLAVFRPNSDR